MHWQKEYATVPPVKVNSIGRVTSGIGWLIRFDPWKRLIWLTHLCYVKVDFSTTSACSFLEHANLGMHVIGRRHEQEFMPEWVFLLQRTWSNCLETTVVSDDKCFVFGWGGGVPPIPRCMFARCVVCVFMSIALKNVGVLQSG